MPEHLLWIEHDPDTTELTDRALHDAGFGVRRVSTEQEGLEFLSANPVAGIVLDHRPPFGDGLQTLQFLRRQRIASPIIMVSGLGSMDLAVKAVKAGAFDFVEKCGHYLPVLIAKLREAIGSALPAPPHRVVRPVFVGRETELRVLDEERARAMAGEGCVALIIGEEGIGKTSLALEIAKLARARGGLVLWGQSHETGGAPAFWPWIQVLRCYVKTADPETLREDLGENAAAVGWILPTLRERCRDLPTADAAELTRFHIVDGIVQFLKRAATRRPLVVVLDDLHNADGDSVHLLRAFASEIADTPVLLLGAYRDGTKNSPGASDLARVASQPLTTVLHIEGFEVGDVTRYVEHATSFRPPDALARAIHAKTEGHPLFVAEITRLLATDDRLADDLASSEFRLAIPATRRLAIAERLSHLSERCRLLLSVAAVIGHEFPWDLVARVVEDESSVSMHDLNEALVAQLVAANDDEPGLYKFAHVLVRQVLYEQLLPTERSRLHACVAEALEEGGVITRGSASVGAEGPLTAIAHHALAAATDATSLQRALSCIVAAGDHAADMMAHEEAARHFELALQVAGRAGLATLTRRHDLLLKLTEARRRSGDGRGAREAGRRALMGAKEAADPMMNAEAALAFAGHLPGFCAFLSDGEVVSELEEALALLPSAASAVRAQVLARLSAEMVYSPRRGSDWTLGQQAIELARSVGDPSVLAAVLRTSQWSVWTPDAFERRRHLAAEILALADRTGDRVLALDGHLLRFWSALEHGEPDIAWQQLQLCERLAGELRLPQYILVTSAARAGFHVATGSIDEAERLAERAYEASHGADDPAVAMFLGAQCLHLKSLRGQSEEVAEWLRRTKTKFPPLTIGLECSLILTYARAGQSDRARAELRALAADDFAHVLRTPSWLMNMAVLANACTALGEVDVAGQLYRHLAPFTTYNVVLPPVLVLAPVAHYVGRLAATMGNESAARRHFEDAIAFELRMGSTHCLALTQIAYGQLLLRSQNPTDAQRAADLIAAGRALADDLHLVPVLSTPNATPTSAPRADARVARLHLVDDTWKIEFHGQSATVRHRVGLTYLRCLLERPGVPVPAIELAGLGNETILVDRSGGPLVDRKAMAQVQHRLAEIEADIVGCERRGAVVGPELLHERAACATYVGGRRSELVSAADRARSGVSKAIGRALKAIRAAHEVLGHHLERHIETGRLCVYIPDPAAPVTFMF